MIHTILKKVYSLLTGFALVDTRLRHIEEHISVLNTEMGRVDIRLDKITEDVAFIRGKLDRS